MRVFGSCLLLFVPLALSAQPATPPAPEAAATATGAFFALSVSDVRASARWYSEKLGLKVVMEQPMNAGAAVTVLEGGGLIVELIQHEGAVSLTALEPKVKSNMFVHGVVKAGALLSNFDNAVATMKKRGVDIAFGPYPARENQRPNAIIRDNAGNLIQFFGQ